MIMKRFVLFLFMFSVYYTSLDAADNGQMNTGRMNQCIDDHIRNREKTYYGYEHVKKEIEDLRKRLDYVMQWHAQTKSAPFDLVIIEDYGNIILFAGGNMYFLFFEPISFFYGYDSRSSYSLLATEVWNISPELKKAIDCFKRARKIVTEKETEGRFDETNSPLLQMGLKCGWRYRYLLFAWPTGENKYDCLFEYDPCNDSFQGQPYYHHLMELIRKIILPWKKNYLLEHNLLPESERKYLEGSGYLA